MPPRPRYLNIAIGRLVWLPESAPHSATVAADWLAGRYGGSMAFYILTGFGVLAVMLL